MSSLSYRWIEQSAMCKILVSAPDPFVPFGIGTALGLGLGLGLGLDNKS